MVNARASQPVIWQNSAKSRLRNSLRQSLSIARALGFVNQNLGVRDQPIGFVSGSEANPLELSRPLVNAPVG